jgi:CDP-glycerol glycerophosphotransferase (TagB/SpsB family)
MQLNMQPEIENGDGQTNDPEAGTASPSEAVSLTDDAIRITAPVTDGSLEYKIVVEHATHGPVWSKPVVTTATPNVASCFVPFHVVMRPGVYLFRLQHEGQKVGKLVGRTLASSIGSETDRYVDSRSARLGDDDYLFDIYVPFTRRGMRLRSQRGEAASFNLHRLEYAYLGKPRLEGSTLRLRGEAFVTGIASSTLQPTLKLLNQKSGTVVATLAGRRCPSPRLQAEYSFGQNDYAEGGFAFDVDLNALWQSGAIEPPCRLSAFLELVAPDGTSYETRLVVRARHRRRGRTLLRFRGLVKDHVLAVIAEEKTDGLVLAHRPVPEADRKWNALRAKIARFLFRSIGKRTNRTWVLFETRGSTAQDNAYYFFRYLIENQPQQKVRFILRRDSSDWPQSWRERLRCVPMFSFRHLWHLLRAEMLISSQSRLHGYQLRSDKSPFGRLLMKKRFVFLQHGVIGLKKIEFDRRNKKLSADIFLSSTREEQEIICREYGYEKNEVPLTGLPRFDVLQDKSKEYRYLLIMPTWREWLKDMNRDAFAATEYYAKYAELLTNEQFISAAKSNGLAIKFYLHFNLHQFMGFFKNLTKEIEFIEQGVMPVNELLMRSSVLVTDYSSVLWDFYQMRKPVVLYHFDLPTYQKEQGAYLDLEGVFGGISAPDPASVAALVTRAVELGERFIPAGVRFEHYDRRNSQRVYDEIMQFLQREKLR